MFGRKGFKKRSDTHRGACLVMALALFVGAGSIIGAFAVAVNSAIHAFL